MVMGGFFWFLDLVVLCIRCGFTVCLLLDLFGDLLLVELTVGWVCLCFVVLVWWWFTAVVCGFTWCSGGWSCGSGDSGGGFKFVCCARATLGFDWWVLLP